MLNLTPLVPIIWRKGSSTEPQVQGALAPAVAPGIYLTNISSGGKMKDTWVLER